MLLNTVLNVWCYYIVLIDWVSLLKARKKYTTLNAQTVQITEHKVKLIVLTTFVDASVKCLVPGVILLLGNLKTIPGLLRLNPRIEILEHINTLKHQERRH